MSSPLVCNHCKCLATRETNRFWMSSANVITRNEIISRSFFQFQAAIRGTYTSDGSFFSKIADPLVGGSYMTLLNTFG